MMQRLLLVRRKERMGAHRQFWMLFTGSSSAGCYAMLDATYLLVLRDGYLFVRVYFHSLNSFLSCSSTEIKQWSIKVNYGCSIALHHDFQGVLEMNEYGKYRHFFELKLSEEG